jgi:hypothetical protein
MPEPSFPFLIEHRWRPETRAGEKAVAYSARFRPDARLIVMPALRTSGFLSALSDEQAKLLLWLLTSLTPNGRLFAPVSLLAKEMGISEETVRRKMAALTGASWDGEPIARHLTDDGMVERYVVSNRLLGQENLPMPSPFLHQSSPGLRSIRDAVLSHSRQRYGRPREQVEQYILHHQLGHDERETAQTPEGDLYRRLISVGVSREAAARLLETENPIEIRQQLDWLPQRAARDPARYLVAAVKGRYAPPLQIRRSETDHAAVGVPAGPSEGA